MSSYGLTLDSYITPVGLLCADDSNIAMVVRILTTNQEQIRKGLVVLDNNQRALYDKVLELLDDVRKVP
jgi:hypothetical protein